MLNEDMLLKRSGNFTASQNHRLMAGWDSPAPSRNYPEFEYLYSVMKKMESKPLVGQIKKIVAGNASGDLINVSGDLINWTWKIIQDEKPSTGLVTYAEEKACEEFFYPDPSLNFSTAHTRNGEEREAECMAMLSDKTGLDFKCTGEDQIHIHADEVGCTPDGIVFDDLDLVETGAEVKCKSPLEHARNLLINDNDELKEFAFEYYTQIQTGMLVTGATHWHFANYNPYAKDDVMKFKNIIVERDDKFIAILSDRIETAKTIKAEFYKKLENDLITRSKQQEAA